MKHKNPCIIRENYSKGRRCDLSADCPISLMKDENQRLKKENRALKNIVGKLELKMSYMKPIDIIGGKKEMGW